MTAERSYYDLLDVPPTADATDIKARWKVLIQVWHPDRFSGETREHAEAMTARINEAFHTLRNDRQRSAYDADLAAAKKAARAKRAAAGAAQTSPSPRTAQAATSARQAPPSVAHVVQAPADGRDAIERLVDDVRTSLRRHPRIWASVAAAWALVIIGAGVTQLTAGPTERPDIAPAAQAVAASVFDDSDFSLDLPADTSPDLDLAEPLVEPVPLPDAQSAAPGELSDQPEAASPKGRTVTVTPKAEKSTSSKAQGQRGDDATSAQSSGRTVTVTPQAPPPGARQTNVLPGNEGPAPPGSGDANRVIRITPGAN